MVLLTYTFPLELRALPQPNFFVAPHTSWVNGPGKVFIGWYKHWTDPTCIAMQDWGWLVVGEVKVVPIPVGCHIPQRLNQVHYRGGVRAALVWAFTCRRRPELSWQGRRVVRWVEARAIDSHRTAMRSLISWAQWNETLSRMYLSLVLIRIIWQRGIFFSKYSVKWAF